MEDESYLFSFDFILEKISNVRNKCLCPGVVFLLMDFPPVLIHLRQVGTPATDSSKRLENIGGVPHKIRRGKSCLMEIRPKELLKELRERGAEVVLLDLQCEGSDPKVIGRAPLNLSATLSSLEEAMRTNKLLTENARYCRQSVHVLDTANEMVATVVVKHRLSNIDSSVRNHITGRMEHSHIHGNQSRTEHSHIHYATNTPEITVLSAAKASPQKERSDQHVRSSAGTLAREKHRTSSQIGSDTALAVNSYTCPKIHSNEATKPLKNSECAEFSTPPQSCSGSEGRVCCISKEDSNAEEDPERLAMYLPNSVCPPPLLYCSEPKPQAEVTWQSEFRSSTTVGTVTTKEPYLASNIDTVANHWSVVMAHDHCSYPITVTRNGLSKDEVKSTQPSAPALPLLTALLEELSILKTHIQLPRTTDNVTASPKREKTEKATQCLQTDNIPDSTSTGIAHEVKKECITKPPQQAKVQFVRECCLRKHGYSGSRRVPRNKSVIYPPDIARNRRKPRPKKASSALHSVKISEKPSATASRSKRRVEGRIISGQKTARRPSRLETREAPVSNAQVPVEKIVSSPTVRKLEVFIPQVSYTASLRSSEANTPVMGSGTSLHIADEPKERSDAQTQTQNDNQDSREMKDNATSTSISLENVSKNSNIEASLQTTDHETYSEKLSEHEELNEEQSVRVSETHSQTATENIDIVITQHSNARRGSLQLSQVCPSPILTRVAVDDSATALSLPISAQFKPGSLLSIGSQAAYDSFMSIDSLDVAAKAVLPKHRRESCVVYLATSQSSVEIDGVGDEKDNSVSEAERISTQEDSCLEAYEYSDDFEQYSEDFEQFSADSSSSSSKA